jgi:hypothetical protein
MPSPKERDQSPGVAFPEGDGSQPRVAFPEVDGSQPKVAFPEGEASQSPGLAALCAAYPGWLIHANPTLKGLHPHTTHSGLTAHPHRYPGLAAKSAANPGLRDASPLGKLLKSLGCEKGYTPGFPFGEVRDGIHANENEDKRTDRQRDFLSGYLICPN